MTGNILLILRILLAASLYIFLAWALFTLWRDLQRESASIASPNIPPIALINPQGAIVCRTNRSEVLIGRDLTCDCALDDATVSTRHARLTYHHTQWWLEDLGSTNGSILNGEKVATALVVTTGDQLSCGKVELTIQIGNEPA